MSRQIPPDRANGRPLALAQRLLRYLAAGAFILAGINHFVRPAFYESILPPNFPAPSLLVAISGVAEIAGGIGLLVPRLRRAAGWGLIALLVAVFPANIYMALSPDTPAATGIAPSVLWLRLPLQGLFILGIWFVALKTTTIKYGDKEGKSLAG